MSRTYRQTATAPRATQAHVPTLREPPARLLARVFDEYDDVTLDDILRAPRAAARALWTDERGSIAPYDALLLVSALVCVVGASYRLMCIALQGARTRRVVERRLRTLPRRDALARVRERRAFYRSYYHNH